MTSLAVGTELLLGQIIDSNSAWIGGELAAHGIDSLVQVKVGDNVDRASSCSSAGCSPMPTPSSCAVGSGPTHDDLTRDAIAAVMGVDLVRDEAVGRRDPRRCSPPAAGRCPTTTSARPTCRSGRRIIPQTRGTAPGLICPVVVDGVDKVIYAVPGVPHEMYDMMHRAVLPDLVGAER